MGENSVIPIATEGIIGLCKSPCRPRRLTAKGFLASFPCTHILSHKLLPTKHFFFFIILILVHNIQSFTPPLLSSLTHFSISQKPADLYSQWFGELFIRDEHFSVRLPLPPVMPFNPPLPLPRPLRLPRPLPLPPPRPRPRSGAATVAGRRTGKISNLQ
ncbi:hypothetical protein O0L34_g3617 [Tuta absoluta]|nr:hypothetical protein O0L34_g3617 [Tuta absoluta]